MAALTERRPDVNEGLLLRIRAEYREMPGLRLTVAQAARLWALDRDTCEAALERLAHMNYLRRTLDGAYTLTSESLLVCAWQRREG